jgi:hypothetical protein
MPEPTSGIMRPLLCANHEDLLFRLIRRQPAAEQDGFAFPLDLTGSEQL